jgi:hypothetical protein
VVPVSSCTLIKQELYQTQNFVAVNLSHPPVSFFYSEFCSPTLLSHNLLPLLQYEEHMLSMLLRKKGLRAYLTRKIDKSREAIVM